MFVACEVGADPDARSYPPSCQPRWHKGLVTSHGKISPLDGYQALARCRVRVRVRQQIVADLPEIDREFLDPLLVVKHHVARIFGSDAAAAIQPVCNGPV